MAGVRPKDPDVTLREYVLDACAKKEFQQKNLDVIGRKIVGSERFVGKGWAHRAIVPVSTWISTTGVDGGGFQDLEADVHYTIYTQTQRHTHTHIRRWLTGEGENVKIACKDIYLVPCPDLFDLFARNV